mmetsp:Transcript_6830/g.10127  ORF Transcript_6830/g.10127 Transcript_6830/m.10127 type:complete len:109 (-) Transcript_6830:450-776(-)
MRLNQNQDKRCVLTQPLKRKAIFFRPNVGVYAFSPQQRCTSIQEANHSHSHPRQDSFEKISHIQLGLQELSSVARPSVPLDHPSHTCEIQHSQSDLLSPPLASDLHKP